MNDEHERLVRKCPKCEARLCRHPWWDDAEENGGRCIGEVHYCHNDPCDFSEYF